MAKFRTLARDALDDEEIERFLASAQRLSDFTADDFDELNITARPGLLASERETEGLI